MKNAIMWMTSTILLFIMLATSCQTIAPPTSVETYSNTKYGFSVNYPCGWYVSEDVYPSGLGSTISFVLEGAGRVSIMVWESEGNPKVDFYSLEDFYERGVMASWEDHEGLEILNERNTTVDKLPAKEVTFTYKTTDFVFKHTIVALLDTRDKKPPNSNAIKIIYDMPIDMPDDVKALYDKPIMYDDYYHDFRLIVDTFKFTEST